MCGEVQYQRFLIKSLLRCAWGIEIMTGADIPTHALQIMQGAYTGLSSCAAKGISDFQL